ncbi:MAG: helix-turn-helix domain-containing protein [Deinococcaceae bacterium]
MEDSVFCPIHRAINILQEKWTMHIVRGLLGGPLGFNELRRIAGGVNAATLSQRLEHLEEIGILTKTIQSTMPPRTRYELTEAGIALQGVIGSIQDWAQTYLESVASQKSCNTH